MDLDEVLRSINDHGRAQLTILLIICTTGQIPAAWHNFAVVFLGAIPEHICVVERNLYDEPLTVDEYSKCGSETTDSNGTSSVCETWVYSNETYGPTIVSEWDLVCDHASLVELSQMALLIGVTVGSLGAGYLADRYGRKKMFFASLFIQGVLGCLEASATSYIFFIIIRVFIGITDQGYQIPLWTMSSELFTPRCRPFTFPCVFISWAVGLMTLAILAYFLRDWRCLQLALSIPTLFFPLFYWFVPESPRWLLSVGRENEAKAILKRLAKINGRSHVILDSSTQEYHKMKEESKYDDATFGSAGTSDGGTETYQKLRIEDAGKADSGKATDHHKHASYLDLFSGKWISLVTVLMFLIWVICALTYYGLTLNSGRLVGDPYLNFFLNGVVEIPAILVTMFSVSKFGRRMPVATFFVIAGLCGWITTFIPERTADGADLTAAIIATAMISKFSITVSYLTICLCTVELFPTVVRNKGVAFVALAARLGAMLAPFILLLGDGMPKFPMLFFATTTLLPCALVFILPEMKGQQQPQSIDDLNKLFQKRGRRSNIETDSTTERIQTDGVSIM